MFEKIDIAALFNLPLVRLTTTGQITHINEQFEALFGPVSGHMLAAISSDFNGRKLQRKIEAQKAYECRLVTCGVRALAYHLTIRADGDGLIGFATDASEAAKADAMLASYSQMMEKQISALNREKDKLEAIIHSFKPDSEARR